MTLAHRHGLFAFVLLGADRQVKRRVCASSLKLAHTALNPGKGEVVASAASFALGTPAPLKAGMCRSCGTRPAVPAYGHDTGRCEPCQRLIHGEQQDRTRRRQGLPERGPRGLRKLRDRAPAIESVSPALMAEMRAELDERLRLATVPGKAGRPRSKGITTPKRGEA